MMEFFNGVSSIFLGVNSQIELRNMLVSTRHVYSAAEIILYG